MIAFALISYVGILLKNTVQQGFDKLVGKLDVFEKAMFEYLIKKKNKLVFIKGL